MFMNVKKISKYYLKLQCFELWARTQGTNFVADV